MWIRKVTKSHVMPTPAVLAGLLVVAAAGGGCKRGVAPVPEILVTAVSPASGPLAGGSPVTITGREFSGVTAATISGRALGNRVVVNDSVLTGIVPAGTDPGPADVDVTAPPQEHWCFTRTPEGVHGAFAMQPFSWLAWSGRPRRSR